MLVRCVIRLVYCACAIVQRLDDVQASTRGQRPAVLALVGLQQAVQLLQVGNYVVFDIWNGDLQPNAAAVEGPRVVSGKHLAYHAGDHRNDLWDRKRDSASGTGKRVRLIVLHLTG